MRFLPLALAMLPALLFVCCASDECDGNKNALPLAGFYSSRETPAEISIDSLEFTGLGAPDGKPISDGTSAISELYIPFRLDSDTTTIVVRYLQSHLAQFNLTDTIRFCYERVPYFVSSACGAMYYFRMEDIECTGLMIDSVTCPVGTITNASVENIRIYFRTSGDGNEQD